eukprot:Filipodium_phascolosomae@DN862_c0_g1_i1.p1
MFRHPTQIQKVFFPLIYISRTASSLGALRCIHYSRVVYFSTKLITVKLSDIGEGIAEVEVLQNLKNVGDTVQEMDEICEVQSDKSNATITSRYDGILRKWYNQTGETIKIGSPLCDMEVAAELDGSPESNVDETATKAAPLDQTINAATQTILAGQSQDGKPISQNQNSIQAVPAARRLAKKLGIDISEVVGSAEGGRITVMDVQQKSEADAKARETESIRISNMSVPSPPIQGLSVNQTGDILKPIVVPIRRRREDLEVEAKGILKAMAKSMSETAKVPHMHIGEDIDVTDLLVVKDSISTKAKKQYGVGLSLTALLIKSASIALKDYPLMNSKYDQDEKKYTICGSHNISIAMDTPNGLLVPNIKGVQDLTMIETQSELLRIAQLAQTNKLAEDLKEGTFTISNVGMIGGTNVHSLLFEGQAAIAGVGRIQKMPRYNTNMELQPRSVMQIGISADHRHLDGATVARFLTLWRSYLENPADMLFLMR